MSDFNDDDLDDILDDCLADVVEHDAQDELNKRKEQEAAEDILKKAMEEGTGAFTGEDEQAKMMQMFQSMLSSGADGTLDASAFEKFQRDVSELVGSLEGVEDLDDDAKANLQRVKELMAVMNTDDEEKAQELLGQINAEGGMPADGNVEETMKRLQETMENLSKLDGVSEADLAELAKQAGPAAATAVPSAPLPKPPQAAASPASTPAAAAEGGDELATMLLETFVNPEFVKPIRLMRDSYGAWIDAHRATLDAAAVERYEKQQAKASEICEFLEVPLTREDDARMIKMMELMHEFSELGEPPGDLSAYAPNPEDNGENQ